MNDRQTDPAPPSPLEGLLAQLDLAAPLATAHAEAAAVLDRWDARAKALQGDREVNDGPQDEANDDIGAHLADCVAEVRAALGLSKRTPPPPAAYERDALALPSWLSHIELRASDDPVKTDLEVICVRCRAHLADAQHHDSFAVLYSVAAGHECEPSVGEESR